MEDERFQENERRQIEVIRELDMEELQVEMVDDDGPPSSDEDERHLLPRGHVDQGTSSFESITFNTCLASLHTYLGEVDDTHGRLTFFDGGAILNLPMFYLEGVVLFPEAVLPLRVIQSEFKAAVERALRQLDAPYTIGVVGVRRHPRTGRPWFGNIGTTAEIRQYKRLEDGSLNVVARGQQRFHLRRRWTDGEGAPCAEVQVIQEDTPLRTPKDAFGQLASVANLQSRTALNTVRASSVKHNKERDEENDWEYMSDASPRSERFDSPDIYGKSDDSAGSEEESTFEQKSDPKKPGGSFSYKRHARHNDGDNTSWKSSNESTPVKKHENGENHNFFSSSHKFRHAYRAPLSFWPRWVYEMYDSYSLARKAADMWRKIIGAPKMDDFINKPDILSFYIASRLPLSQSTRQELLEIHGVSYRLQREVQLLECFNLVRCKNCQTVIAKRSDMLVMSSDGPLGAYVNPHGYVHEIMTFYHTTGLALLGPPVKEHSWFPGYAWTITNCAMCESNMGWLFTATNKKLRPKYFWGIRSSQVADDTSQIADDTH